MDGSSGMKPTVSFAVSLTLAAMALQPMAPSTGAARADPDNPLFAMPSGNVECHMGASDQALGPITCDSETTGMTCTDNSTGHYFRLSRDNCELH